MSVDIELRKAAAHINAGRIAAARSILSTYLKDFPDSDLAWLLLSYVVEDPRKQRAAVGRALRLNPENAEAKKRLDQLTQSSSSYVSYSPSSGDDTIFKDSYPFNEIQEGPSQQPTRPMSIEERLAFVSLEVEDDRGHLSNEYSSEPFFSGDTSEYESLFRAQQPKKRNYKWLVIGGVLLVALIAGASIGIKYVSGGFISKEDSLATASVETQVAQATNDAHGLLPPVWTATPTITGTAPPTTIPTPLPTGTATLPAPDPTVVVEIEILQQQVSKLRELPISESVDTYMIMRPQVRPLLESYYYSHDGSDEEIKDSGRVLVALGLIDPRYDLLTNTLNSLTDSLGGFYLHDTNKIYVVGNDFSAVEKFIYAHEYTHALVDQNYDLSGLALYPRCEGNEDRCKAIQALVEGDATKLMTQWLEQAATTEEYLEIVRYRPPTRILPEQNPPPFAVRNSEFPYDDGQTFVETLLADGGWLGVNQAYQGLPESTEQILHPEKYLAGETPKEVSGVLLEGVLTGDWRMLRSNTLGEWLTYLILGYGTNSMAHVGEDVAVSVAEGWGGDHYQVYFNDTTNETVLVVHWKWDQSNDTKEFENGMRYYLGERFSEGQVASSSGECWEGNDQVTCMYNSDQQSLWILAPNMDMMQSIESLYPAFQ